MPSVISSWKSVDLTEYEGRLETFQYWSIPYIKPEDLAKAGFFYTGNKLNDAVECYSCETALAYWEEGDDPQKEHEKASPNCPFLLNRTELPNRGTPKRPELNTFDTRLKTFESKWKHTPQKSSDLADAGFFYSGEDDKCECYYCGVVLKDCQMTDEPWKKHAHWSPDCNYVTLVQGKQFVDDNYEYSSKLIPSGFSAIDVHQQ